MIYCFLLDFFVLLKVSRSKACKRFKAVKVIRFMMQNLLTDAVATR